MYLCLEERLQDMKYSEFESIISPERMRKYNVACGGNTAKAMTLYRYNLRLSQEMFVVVSCFEIALRNRIDQIMRSQWGNDWLRDSIHPSGMLYSDKRVEPTKKKIEKAYNELAKKHIYSHSKLLSEMEFGLWKYMFANVQYRLSGRILLRIFPNKPKSSQSLRFDNTYVFGELDYINNLRNRIAHHEPICFGNPVCIDTFYAKNRYNRIMELFRWMDIDGASLLYGLGHISNACEQIDKLLQ